jgi:hypothetical protein
VLSAGLKPVVAGVAAGLPLAGLLAGGMRAFLPGVSAWDPASMAAAATVLVAGAIAAVALPAHRAGRTDPALALRAE